MNAIWPFEFDRSHRECHCHRLIAFLSTSEIEEIRGVAVGSVLKSLEPGLIDVVGRAEGIGRPLLYATSDGRSAMCRMILSPAP
jgi:hypothetical protein